MKYKVTAIEQVIIERYVEFETDDLAVPLVKTSSFNPVGKKVAPDYVETDEPIIVEVIKVKRNSQDDATGTIQQPGT